MAYELKPVYYFEDGNATGIDEIPLSRIVIVQDYLGETRWFVKHTNDGLNSTSTIFEAITAKNITSPLDEKANAGDIYTTTEAEATFRTIVNSYSKEETEALSADKVSSNTISTIWTGTQVEYDALGLYDDNTIYFIK